jgi:excinuclease UvrABC nuclease subunit
MPAPILIQASKRLPNKPGVYLFLDADDRPLYVGKSVRIRQRVASYLRKNQSDMEERIQRMVHESRSIRHIETQTELLALLLEDALIKKYLPIYNIKQKQFRDYQYVWISDDPFPRMKRIDATADMRSEIFGPFKDRFFVDRLQEIFSRYLGFRSCQEAHPEKRCIELDLGQCLGPCVLPEVRESYLVQSQKVREFLQGTDPGITDLIEAEIQKSIASLRFEHASRLRDDLIFCDHFFHRQRFNHRFRRERLEIRPSVLGTPIYHFEKGALQEVVFKNGQIKRPGEQLDLFDLSIVKEDDPRFLLDRANLVFNWLNKNREDLDFQFEASGSV